ncbi:MAG: hypothetical protein IJ396_02125 [Oscillibacter sp.]|nr:hypothetical protein [Oscillibacter sp.]
MPYQSTQIPAATSRMMNQQFMPQATMNQQNMSRMSAGQDWSGEVTPMAGANAGMGMNTSTLPAVQSQLQMTHGLPSEVIEAPTDREEAFLGSLKATLIRNKGNYIVATFLVGTQNTVTWEGILYEVGNDFVTIYQEGRDRYIVSDIYSLRYMEFYDIRRRELCDAILSQQPWQGSM